MAMTDGHVKTLKFGTEAAFLLLTDTTGQDELFILWFGDGNAGSPTALFTAELTVAMARGLKVTIGHGDNSAYVEVLHVHSTA